MYIYIYVYYIFRLGCISYYWERLTGSLIPSPIVEYELYIMAFPNVVSKLPDKNHHLQVGLCTLLDGDHDAILSLNPTTRFFWWDRWDLCIRPCLVVPRSWKNLTVLLMRRQKATVFRILGRNMCQIGVIFLENTFNIIDLGMGQ